MIRTKLFSMLALVSLSVAACGGGDGGGSGVDGSKSLAELNAAEKQDICDYGQSLISEADSLTLGCYFSALFFAETEADCQIAFDACIAEGADPTEESCSIEDPAPACAAQVTVAEIEACTRAQADAVSSLAKSLSCASDPGTLENLDELPPACKTIEAKCPELFEDANQGGA